MRATTFFRGDSLAIFDYRCQAGPADRPFVEVRDTHSLSYVRRGSFGCRTQGEAHELVAGSVLVVRPGREYMATHEHHGCGDECLSMQISPALADSLGAKVWDLAHLPPLPELVVLGELAQAAAEGHAGMAVEEAALFFTSKLAQIASGKRDRCRPKARERRRAIEAALWIEENAAEPVRLEATAREAGLSPFHFLRLFTKVTGVTPHQYLLRTRLRRAASLLARGSLPVTEVALEAGFADLSNFVRTFKRAAGMSPGAFRKIFQDRPAALA